MQHLACAPFTRPNGATCAHLPLASRQAHATLVTLHAVPQAVYEFLLRYVVSSDTDARVAKRYIDQGFVVRLLALFDSGEGAQAAAAAAAPSF